MKRIRRRGSKQGITLLVAGLLLVACSSAPAANTPLPNTLSSGPLAESGGAVDVSAFVGQWFQHAGDISVQSDGSIDMTYQVERLGAAADFPHLKLKIASVSGKTAVARVMLSDDPAVTTGSTLSLRRTEPGLAVIFPSGIESDWCDLQHKDQGACGV
jgi:hypothetical protein